MLPRTAGTRESVCNLSVSGVINNVKILRNTIPTYHGFSLIEISLIGAIEIQEHRSFMTLRIVCQIWVQIRPSSSAGIFRPSLAK